LDVKEYYKILNLNYGASKNEVKNSYRQLAKKYHPDINPSHDAKVNFIKVNKAYDVLINLPEDYFAKELERKRKSEQYRTKNNFHDEEFRRRTRDRAKAKFEQKKQQQEDFKKSGFYDMFLLLQYLLHYVIAIASVLLIIFPVFIYFREGYLSTLFMVFSWVIGGTLGYYIISNRKTYFKIGKFYYSPSQVNELIFRHRYTKNYNCYYCKNHVADALPYKVHLLRIKDVVLDNKGPLQHHVGYKRRNVAVAVPRSKKALIIHFTSTIIRIFSIIFTMFFLPIDALVWRFIFGLVIGTTLSYLFQQSLGTKARNSYIFTYGFIAKIATWLLILSLFSSFDIQNLNIYGSDRIGVIIVILFLSDPLIEAAIKLFFKNNFYKPLVKQPSKVEELLDNNFQYYLDISGWSMLYPMTKWIFG
jgi:hypothetical protein